MEMCPCGSGNSYETCCEPMIRGTEPATTAEAMLRSRYTAHAKREVGYIVQTTHPDKRSDEDEKTVDRWTRKTEWHSLKILESENGGPEDDEGTLSFEASYTEKGEKRKHQEIATFKKVDGTWYFYDAEMPTLTQFVREGPKIGRNDPCPCDSGKKYKKCCGK